MSYISDNSRHCSRRRLGAGRRAPPMPPHFRAGLVGLCQSDYSHYTAPSWTQTGPWGHCARDGRVGGRHAAAAVRCRRIPDSAGPCALCRAAAGLADFESASTQRRRCDVTASVSASAESARRLRAESAARPR